VIAEIANVIAADPRYAHTSHLRVDIDRKTLFDRHFRGPMRADVFSVTKTVVSSLVGIAVADGLLPSLDATLDDLLDAHLAVGETPSSGQTLRHLLTMTRGSETDGAWDIDEVMAAPSGWTQHILRAPRRHEPGTHFEYDNGAGYLAGVAVAARCGRSLSAFADERLFRPLGITGAHWFADPDGWDVPTAHLLLTAADLAALGQLWLDGGRRNGEPLIDPEYAAAMTTAQNPGGPPEGAGYGYLTWVADGWFFAGGWAGQHVIVVPSARAVIITTGGPQFDPGPPPTDRLPPDWRAAKELIAERLLPLLR
jgi:CubicO group peptidase (beta-lactamase class C family)